MKEFLYTCFFIMAIISGTAQDSVKQNALQISGYAEVYCQYDFNNPISNSKYASVYSFNRNNEVTLNLGFLKAAYQNDKLRANLALAVGTYMNANYAAEAGTFKNMLEANIGLKISKQKNLWLDAGIFPSHIGFESAIGKDCWNLTRSILADNSPYFETGVKLGYTSPNEKLFLSALLLNGWQRIQRPEGNSTPAFGTQITFKLNKNITLNASSFIGSDKPDSVRQMRYFHNFYGIFQLNKKWGAIIGFDIGAEQKNKGSIAMNTWYSPVLIVKYAAGNKIALAVRGEYYADKNGVIISTGTDNGFQTWGLSANLDYLIANYIIWRIEAKTWSSKDKIFEKRNSNLSGVCNNLVTAIAINF